jgi:hypothetical protein
MYWEPYGNQWEPIERNIMQQELNNLLIEIKKIALEKEEYYIIKLIDDISDLLGDNYEIYKLEENVDEIFRKGD